MSVAPAKAGVRFDAYVLEQLTTPGGVLRAAGVNAN